MSDPLQFSDQTAARWEWTADEVRRIGHVVVDLIAQHLSGLPDEPVFRPFPNDRARTMLGEPLPEEGLPVDAILARFAEDVMAFPFGNGHPRFAAWVNGPPVIMGVFAEALAAAMNPSVAGGNHAATYVERQVLEWLKELVGFPADGMGLLVSGGSAATIVALACARQRHVGTEGMGVQGRERPLAVYASDQGHSAITKAVELLGLGPDALRQVATDTEHRIDLTALEEAICADVEAGVSPMAVAVSAGTVNTGAIDPLAGVRDVCDRHHVWMHVDGAYGAPAILDPRYHDALAPLARADSVALDAHKWLYVPYDAGVILVRDAELMRRTFSRVASYVREQGDPDGVTWLPWFSEYGVEQTRPFRALKIWMALQHHGRGGYAEAIARDNRLADHLAALVDEHPRLELVAHNLSVVCLRATATALDDDEVDELNREVLRSVQLGGDAFISSTDIDGRFVLRACFVNPRTTRHDVERIIDSVALAARSVHRE